MNRLLEAGNLASLCCVVVDELHMVWLASISLPGSGCCISSDCSADMQHEADKFDAAVCPLPKLSMRRSTRKCSSTLVKCK